jgi:dihydrofolate reductase
MRDVILGMSLSLDGFVAGPNDENDWIFQASTADSREWAVQRCWNAGVHIMGSRSFAGWAGYWPTAAGPFAPPMNEIPKVVFSRTGEVPTTTPAVANAPAPQAEPSAQALATWKNPRVASGPLADEIAKLKREDGKPIGVAGGATFAQSLVRANLVDEYQLAIHPIALGAGKPLFATLDARFALALVDMKRFAGGIVALVYRRR